MMAAVLRVVAVLMLVTALLAACQAGGGPTGSASAAAGHAIHVNLYVPLASNAALGSTCDATALKATGPVAVTIPGSTLKLLRVVGGGGFPAAPTPPEVPGSAPADSTSPAEPGLPSANGPAATIGVETIGEQLVPQSGKVAGPISSNTEFPTACLFSFDVVTTTDLDRYLFSVGKVYFPVPLITGRQLQAAGWVANIGVDPQ